MKFYKNYSLLLLFTIFYNSLFSQTDWYTEDFESISDITTIDGKTVGSISPGMKIWYDGGSNCYQNTTEDNSGGSSFVIAGPGIQTQTENGVEIEKPYYGSIYTNRLDLRGVTELSMEINYLLTNKSVDKFGVCTGNPISFDAILSNCWVDANDPGGHIEIQYSKDGGETFVTRKVFNTSEMDVIYSSSQQFKNRKIECQVGCEPLSIVSELIGIDAPKEICLAACSETWNTKDASGYYWNAFELDFTTLMRGLEDDSKKNMVFRIKSFLPEFDFGTEVGDKIFDGSYARFFMDDITIKATGTPKFSEETIQPVSDPVTSGRTLYNTENFNDASNDWGIWEDGGRSAYSTEFLAATGRGICLRDFYSGKSNGVDPTTGEDLGYQKPTYSSIVTKNLDFTEVKDLEMSFSFVPYQMSLYDPTTAELIAAGNNNLVNEDGESILGYVPGKDRVEISISTNSGIDYTLLKTLTYSEDFINKTRYNINVNIPGNLTSAGALTTTTKIKIQCFSDTESQQFYIDDLSLYTIGTSSSLEGSPRQLDWASYNQTTLNANASVDTYEHINSQFIIPEYFDNSSFEGNNPSTDSNDVSEKPGIYGAVEHSDCTPSEYGQSITQIYDNELGKTVFSFNMDEDQDTDRCRLDGLYDDRQRIEIKTYSQSYDYQKAEEGETHYLAWKMKLPSGFDASDKFTHLHQLKPKGGVNEGMPTITLTANGPKVDLDTGDVTAPAQLNLRYSPTTVSQVTVTSAPISDLEGTWIQFLEKVTYGTENEGRYELLIYKDGDIGGTPILDFKSYSFETWKGGDFVRPKWGIYRSIVQPDKIKDETILFSDISILEVSNKNDGQFGDLDDFGIYINNLSNEESEGEITGTACAATAPTNLNAIVTDNSSTLTWDNTTANYDYHNVRYSILGENNWTKVQVKDDINTLEINNLLDETNYEWQIRTICEDGTGSNYLDATGAFSTSETGNTITTTDCVASAPINLNVTYDSGYPILSWEMTTENISHNNVRYSVSGENNWTKIQVTGNINFLELTDLAQNTTYDWQIRTVCEDGTGSNYLHAVGPNFISSGLAGKQLNSGVLSSGISSISNFLKPYPNPTSDKLNLNLRLIEDNTVFIKLYTINGTEIPVNENFSSSASFQSTATHDVSDLPNGVYFIRVVYNNQTDIMKFIKN